MSAFGKLMDAATSRYGLLVPAAFVAFQVYLLVRPAEVPLDPARAEAADRVAAQVADAIGVQANGEWGDAYVRVGRLGGDHGDHIRGRIEEALPSRVNCSLVTDTVLSELRDSGAARASRLGLVKPKTADAWKTKPVATLDEALALAKESDLDYVVFGRVRDFRSLHDFVFLDLEIGVASAEDGSALFIDTFEDGDEKIFADVSQTTLNVENRSSAMRVSAWALLVILLPICTSRLWSNLLDRESRGVNAFCLAALTLADLIAAWALMGFWVGTAWRKAALAGALGIAFVWNLFILGTLEKNRAAGKFA